MFGTQTRAENGTEATQTWQVIVNVHTFNDMGVAESRVRHAADGQQREWQKLHIF